MRPHRAAPATTLERALRRIESQPPVRRDRVTAVRRRVDVDGCPSADEVAEMLVRRSLCDSLR